MPMVEQTLRYSGNKQAQERALADYQNHLGKLLIVTMVEGIKDHESFSFTLEQPAIVRVVETKEKDVLHLCGGVLDPYWDLQLVEPNPELNDCICLWTFGYSYGLHNGKRISEANLGWKLHSPFDFSGFDFKFIRRLR